MTDFTIETWVGGHRCPCGGTVEIGVLADDTPVPPGCLPIVVTHTLPACDKFTQLEAADFVSYLVRHLTAPAPVPA
ncbi:MAG: hypothetical protein IT338_17470 [Thermomicrobiales bacterium]|nr:hypothetical protein [Thermomicrobiales bacterium]